MTTLHKYELKSETIKFDKSLQFDNDLWILNTGEDRMSFYRTTLLTITVDKDKIINIRIDWSCYSDMDFSTLIIPETDKLFFGASFFWGIIDLNKIKIERQQDCFLFWYFERHSDTIVIISELEAESLNLKGETIDLIPIDPPFEIQLLSESIEFITPTFGRQELKLK